MTRTRAFFALFVALVAPACWMRTTAPGRASPVSPDGHMLLESCALAEHPETISPDDPSKAIRLGYCYGYVSGLTELANTINTLVPRSAALFCAPPMTNDEAVSVITTYLRGHPDELTEDRLTLALRAMVKAFPCEPAQP